MATTSEIKSGLDSIAATIARSVSTRATIKNNLLSARNQLADLVTVYADVIATINGWSPPTGAFQQVADSELAALTTEFLALKTDIEAELTALGVAF